MSQLSMESDRVRSSWQDDREPNLNAGRLRSAWEDDRLVGRPGFGFYPETIWSFLQSRTKEAAEGRGIKFGNLSIPQKDRLRCHVLNSTWKSLFPNSSGSCPPFWDGASCIPPTLYGERATFPCMQMYDGRMYSTHKNATRDCLEFGYWGPKTNYSMCEEIEMSTGQQDIEISIIVYFVGYSISLFALLVALCIFFSFREMRHMRHKIHIGLFLTYVFTDLAWIITSILQNVLLVQQKTSILVIWCSFRNLLSYFHLATFFWMFLEGLYLFCQVQIPLSLTNVKHRHFLIFGWGGPLLVISIWGILRNSLPASHRPEDKMVNSTDSGLQVYDCPFLSDHPIDFLAYKVPVFILLFCNAFFLVWIMVIVICKLRAERVMDYDKKHWRAAKALIVVIPLLGFTYLLTLMGPDREANPTGYLVFQCIRAVLLSTQGFVITLPYCFMNTEVRSVLRSRWGRWQLIRNVGGDSTRTSMVCSSFLSQDSRPCDRVRGKLLPSSSNIQTGMLNNNSDHTPFNSNPVQNTLATVREA